MENSPFERITCTFIQCHVNGCPFRKPGQRFISLTTSQPVHVTSCSKLHMHVCKSFLKDNFAIPKVIYTSVHEWVCGSDIHFKLFPHRSIFDTIHRYLSFLAFDAGALAWVSR